MKFLKILGLFCVIALGFFAENIIGYFDQDTKRLDEKYCLLSTNECVQDQISMVLEHDVAKPLFPSTITVHWPKTNSDQLTLSLKGLEMDMGVNRFQLQKQADGSFIGSVQLPICVQDQMTWFGTLSDGNNEVYPAIRIER